MKRHGVGIDDRPPFLRAPTGFAIALGLFVMVGAAAAQDPDADHSAHHPPDAAVPETAAPKAAIPTATPVAAPDKGTPPAGNQIQMMQGMMEGMRAMHGIPPRELYPTLMALPAITPAIRAAIQTDTDRRFQAGILDLNQSVGAFTTAASAENAAAMSDAVARLHAAAAELESTIAARRALAEGLQPRELARDWFKQRLNISSPPLEAYARGIFGLSWFHLSVMAALTVAFTGLAGLYLRRMLRATTLLERLADIGTTVPSSAGLRPLRQAEPPPSHSIQAPLDPARPNSVSLSHWSGRLRLVATFRETPSVKTFRFANLRDGDIPFIHVPGQFVTLEIPIAGKIIKRSYTIASSPTQRRHIELTIKREENGLVSRHVHDALKMGDELSMTGPSGGFTFTGSEADNIVLIAGGVGITPMMSVLRYLVDCAWPGEIFLIYACRSTDEFIFAEELAYLQKRHARLQVVGAMTRAEGSSWAGPRGHITKSLLADAVPGIAGRRVHLCGPAPMMTAVQAVLAELGVPSHQIKTEAFGPAAGAPQSTVPLGIGPASSAGSGTVTFARTGKSALLQPGESVLEVADQVGVAIDNSCRAGTCGSCKVKLLSGSVTMATKDALSEAEEKDGIILACQARSNGNITVDA